jgi:hypothetical protein
VTDSHCLSWETGDISSEPTARIVLLSESVGLERTSVMRRNYLLLVVIALSPRDVVEACLQSAVPAEPAGQLSSRNSDQVRVSSICRQMNS